MSSSPVLAEAGPGPDAQDDERSAILQDRLEPLAQLRALNGELLACDSATAALQAWCDRHGGPGLSIAAQRLKADERAADAEVRALLGAAEDEAVVYRRVRLVWGDRVLSEADNWYRPGLLTDEMNRALEETDTPFGVAVRGLGYRRVPLDSEILSGSGEPAAMRHRALLALPDGPPISLVVETYSDGVVFGS